ncbi:MAG TPA: RDD family protein [Candidatus Dormibacteraeota bacterium]
MIASPTSTASRGLPAWERLAAAVIDFLVLAVAWVILLVILVGHDYSRLAKYAVAHSKETHLGKDPRFVHLSHQLTAPLFHVGIAAAAVTALYLIGMYLGTGATLGKLALGLRITRVDGSPMTIWNAVLRSLVFWLGNPLFIPIVGVLIWLLEFIVGTLLLLTRSDHRGPEDFLGRTFVVRKEDQGRSLAELTGRGPILPSQTPPPAAPPLRGGHLPGWGPVDQPSPPPPTDPGEAPS